MRAGIVNSKEFSINIEEGDGFSIYQNWLALAGSYFVYRCYFSKGHSYLFFSPILKRFRSVNCTGKGLGLAD